MSPFNAEWAAVAALVASLFFLGAFGLTRADRFGVYGWLLAASAAAVSAAVIVVGFT